MTKRSRIPNRQCQQTKRSAAWGSVLLALFVWTQISAQCESGSLDDPSPLTLTYRLHQRILLPAINAEIGALLPAERVLIVVGAGGAHAVDLESGKPRGEAIDGPATSVATSVAAHGQKFAIAWASEDKSEPGVLWLYDATTRKPIETFSAGFHPDMAVFSPDGRFLLAANEGEPADNYVVDREGSITVVDFGGGQSAKVSQIGFRALDKQREELQRRGVRISGPSHTRDDLQASVAEDLEPEYIAVSADSRRAWATLQENNAIAEIDLLRRKLTAIHPLGSKNFRRIEPTGLSTGLDPSDRDEGIRIRHWPVLGMFQPDGAVSFEIDGVDYLVTANEGDVREYGDYRDYCRANELVNWDVSAQAQLLVSDDQLGRLDVCPKSCDIDDDGDADRLVTFGARSFAVWRAAPGQFELAFESGSDFERTMAMQAPDRFNSNGGPDSNADERSPIRGPEPEGVAIGVVDGRRLAFISLERPGGAMVYDLSNPAAPDFVDYIKPVDNGKVCDCGPEGLEFVSAEESPLGKPLLIICNEVSGTVSIYALGLAKRG